MDPPCHEHRVHNDVSAYEVYIRIETTGDSFFQEIRGETLPTSQADVATFSTFIRSETAQSVSIDDIWFETADS